MAICLSEITGKRKLFLGDFDPVRIGRGESNIDSIVCNLKLAALLYDHILIPTAYLWQSDLVGNKLTYFQDFIGEEILLPTIREEDRDIQDRFEQRLDETNRFKNTETLDRLPFLDGELTKLAQKKYLQKLKDQDHFVYLNDKSVSNCFRQLWEKDLNRRLELDVGTESIATYLHQNLDENQVQTIISQLLFGSELEYISRTTLTELTCNCLDREMGIGKWDQNYICDRISWLYLFATAQASDCDLYVSGMNDSQSTDYANLELYLKTLDSVHITKELLQTFSVKDIIAIRRTMEYQSFIQTYQKMLNKVKLTSDKEAEKMIRRLLLKKKTEKFQQIISKIKIIKKTTTAMALGLLINYIGGVSLNNPIIGIFGIAAIIECIAHVDMRISLLEFDEYIIRNFQK